MLLKEAVSRITDIHSGYAARFFSVLAILPLGEGSWLAGGSIRRLFDGSTKESDYDLFFTGDVPYNRAKDKLLAIGKIVMETPVVTTIVLDSPKGARIQLIKMYKQTHKELLNSFDFTLCQFATEGLVLYLGDYTLYDVGRKMCSPVTISYPASSIRRLLKYSAQGYTICQKTIDAITEACRLDLTVDPKLVEAFNTHSNLSIPWID